MKPKNRKLNLCYLSPAERKQYQVLGRKRKKESDDKVRMAKQIYQAITVQKGRYKFEGDDDGE